ncbi:MAG: hypothetical protein QW666_02470 [Candidatus Woesearchaeota archaeon]
MGFEDTCIGSALIDMYDLIETGLIETKEIRTTYRKLLEKYPYKKKLDVLIDAWFEVTDRKYGIN